METQEEGWCDHRRVDQLPRIGLLRQASPDRTGLRCNRTKFVGGAVPAIAEDGSDRSISRRNRARL